VTDPKHNYNRAHARPYFSFIKTLSRINKQKLDDYIQANVQLSEEEEKSESSEDVFSEEEGKKEDILMISVSSDEESESSFVSKPAEVKRLYGLRQRKRQSRR